MTMKIGTLVAAVSLTFGNVRAASPAEEMLPQECANPSVKYIQRTMRKLSESTAEKPATVRICFYGQSIVAQEWTHLVISNLVSRFPTARIICDKPAIGGYPSPHLIRTAEPDLYPLYPDLLFFHVYGPLDKYEGIIREMRRRTTSEIILWSSHLNEIEAADPAAKLVQRDKRTLGIRSIAERHHCMFIDLNRKWAELLLGSDMKAGALVSGVHLRKNALPIYAGMLTGELVRLPDAPDLTVSGGVITTVKPEVREGRMIVPFVGNRLLAVSDGTGKAGASARVLLDGKPLSECPELWAATRPSAGPMWMPCVNRVAFERTPVAETWTLTYPDGIDSNRSVRARFTLSGSVTGPDGEGVTTEDFLSKSGRVRIMAEDHAAAKWQCGMFRKPLKPGFVVRWQAYPLFVETYSPQPAGVETRLVQNCRNDAHVLEIVPDAGSAVGDLGLGSFVSFAPPGK